MITPHGGHLVDRTSNIKSSDVSDLPTFEITTELAEDIINIAKGLFSPLEGFAGYNDLNNIVTEKRLLNDTPWTIPILLDWENKKKSRDGLR